MGQAEVVLLKCTLLFLYLSVGLCQRDCTGVDCPMLDNCMEEVLESGACCASCLQKGCTCEGYQYYDCINAGFKNGKVPEGDSYFVDYGSTECSCPAGGGRISCHFMSCPDLPTNCIEVLEPADGCMECERVGCAHDGQKYDAGHSFHIDPCRVCHCPNEGGKLMCYPVPDCDPQKVHKPALTPPTEDNIASRSDSNPYRLDQQGQTDQFSTPYHFPPNENLPLFKLPLDKEEPEDYDYGPTDKTYPQSLVFPTQSSSSSPSSNKVVSVSRGSARPDRTSALQSFDRRGKLELRERYGVHDHPADREEVTESPLAEGQSTVRPHMHAITSWQPSQGPTSAQGVLVSDFSQHTDLENPLHAHSILGSFIFPLNRVKESDKHPEYPHATSESVVHHQMGTETKAHHQIALDSVTLSGSNSQINVSDSVGSTATPSYQESVSDRVSFSLNTMRVSETPIHPDASTNGQKELQGAVTAEDEERLNEDEIGEEKEQEIVTFQSVTGTEGKDVSYKIKSAPQEINHKDLANSDPTSIYERTTPEPDTSSTRMPEYPTTPMVHFITTSTQPPVKIKVDESQSSKKPGQRLFNLHSEGGKVKEEVKKEDKERKHRPVLLINPDEGPGVSAEDILQSCCAAGQSWAAENSHCNHMPLLTDDKHSVCSVAQKQCCLISVKESRCESGVTSARGGDTCEVSEEDACTDDSYQVCCSCCALGLRMRSEGRGCDSHQHLGYPCGHIFLSCCEEEEGPSQILLKKKTKPRPTSLPRKVLDSKFPKEAFSISATDEAANAVEEQEDVDECQLYSGQLCQHTCANTWGSYRCGCHQGYILQQDGHSCAPVSPEEDNRVREVDRPAVGPTQATTTTTSTSATTTCLVRYDPCAENGDCSQQCTAVAGQARCSCFPGFLLMTDGRMCEDVDECVTNTHSCRPSEHCVNTVGSFVCELQITCPAGYQLRNSVCEDIDECMGRTHDCGTGFVCENTVGSFLCKPKHKCISGFTQDPHGNCIDINECSSLSEPCSSGFNCINTVGSYTCQQKIIMCSHGYHASPDGAKCVDIDECQMGTHRCGVGQICHNLPGSYRCDCQTGYQYDTLRKVCTDVNECWRYPGRLCAQTCENTPGSYHCSCTAGFSLAFDGKNCEDINECDKNPCSQECANIYGSYQCYCRQGYFLKEDGHTCEDIDECSQSIGNLCAFQCVNVAGSYQCACPPHGYSMSANGHTCKDIDECTTGTHNCSFRQTCYNLQGGFRCLSLNCPDNYKKVSDTRCERITCPTNSMDCQNSPVRITYYQLSFQTNIITPAQIFRIGPSPAYSGDHIVIGITKGNEEGYFSTRKLNSFTGAVYLQRQVREPKDFTIDVEMKLLRQGTLTSFLARIYVFITSTTM